VAAASAHRPNGERVKAGRKGGDAAASAGMKWTAAGDASGQKGKGVASSVLSYYEAALSYEVLS